MRLIKRMSTTGMLTKNVVEDVFLNLKKVAELSPCSISSFV